MNALLIILAIIIVFVSGFVFAIFALILTHETGTFYIDKTDPDNCIYRIKMKITSEELIKKKFVLLNINLNE